MAFAVMFMVRVKHPISGLPHTLLATISDTVLPNPVVPHKCRIKGNAPTTSMSGLAKLAASASLMLISFRSSLICSSHVIKSPHTRTFSYILLKSASPSYFTLSLYGIKSPSIQPSLPMLLYSGISCALRLITSLIYLTRSFALSLVTSMPLSASCVILFLFSTVPLSTVTSRHLPSLKNSSFTFSVSVSMFIYRSTGSIG